MAGDAPIPFVDLWAQHEKLRDAFVAAFDAVLRDSAFIRGDQLTAFEGAFADLHGVSHAIGCSSGTDALVLAARALDLGAGDEVITVPHTWISTVFAISQTGATPVFVDIDPRTRQMDVEQVRRAITPRTRAVFAVHMYGHPVALTELAELCRAKGIALVEDVAQATLARYDNTLCGTVGDIGCFSFFPSKNLGCLGDGGCVLTRNDALAARIRRLADYGQDPRYVHHEIGMNSRLDNLQAAFLNVKLPHLPDWVAARRRLAARYDALLADLLVVTPFQDPRAQAAYHLYAIETDRRDACLDYLRERGVMAQVHYPNMVPYQPCYAGLGYRRGAFPVAEASNARLLSLPIYPEMTDEQQDRVAAILRSFYA